MSRQSNESLEGKHVSIKICQMTLSFTTRCQNTMVSNFIQVAGVKYCLTDPRLGFTPFFWNGLPRDRAPKPPHLCGIQLIPLDDSFHFSFYRTNFCDSLFLHSTEPKIVFNIYEGIYKRNRANAV